MEENIEELLRMSDTSNNFFNKNLLLYLSVPLGIQETTIEHPEHKINLFAFGGQRTSNNSKLITRAIDNLKIPIYLVNLTNYFKVLFEDESVSRMEES
eukprot:gene11028-3734_t